MRVFFKIKMKRDRRGYVRIRIYKILIEEIYIMVLLVSKLVLLNKRVEAG